jgi:hypothetical protein
MWLRYLVTTLLFMTPQAPARGLKQKLDAVSGAAASQTLCVRLSVFEEVQFLGGPFLSLFITRNAPVFVCFRGCTTPGGSFLFLFIYRSAPVI